jgi:hypothetical protein
MIVVSSLVSANICEEFEPPVLLKLIEALREAVGLAATRRVQTPDEYDRHFRKAMEVSRAALVRMEGHKDPAVSKAAHRAADFVGGIESLQTP